MNGAPSIVRPALLMGALFGFVTSLPFVDAITVCTCCSLVALCGFAAAYMHSGACKTAGVPFQVGAGALVGLLAGLVYGVVAGVVGTIITLLVGDIGGRALLEWMSNLPNIPEDLAVVLEEMLEDMDGSFTAAQFFWHVFTSLGIGAIFSTVGGLIGGAVFKVDAATAPAPPPPAPPPIGGEGPQGPAGS